MAREQLGRLIAVTVLVLAVLVVGTSKAEANSGTPPSVTTANVTNISPSSATLWGLLESLDPSTSANASFQWGLNSGNYTHETPVRIMITTGLFSYVLTGLSANTIYYFRAKAVGDITSFGSEKTLTTTPSTSLIAFTYYGWGPEIYVVNSDGSNRTRLTFAPPLSRGNQYPSLSPDGRRIAFMSWRPSTYYADIYVMNADGGYQNRLTFLPGYASQPEWSPDGSKIAFVYIGNIWVVNIDGSNQHQLSNTVLAYLPSWSNDGTKIAYQDGSSISIMNADGSGQHTLAGSGGSPSWSPDGSKIAFSSTRSGISQIYVMDADGGNQTPVTTVVSYNPTWSPDGSHIAFDNNSIAINDPSNIITVMNADGTNQTMLTEGFYPSWGGEGTAIVPIPPSTMPPNVTTVVASNLTATSARLNGNVISLGTTASANVSFQWGASSGIYTNETPVEGTNTTGSYSYLLTGLSDNTSYYFRAKVVGDGTTYGVEQSFTTTIIIVPPSVTTDNSTSVTSNSAWLHGKLTSLGSAGSANASFRWGTVSGNLARSTAHQVVTLTGNISAGLTGLSANTTYYFQAMAAGDGTTYGEERSFTTLPGATPPPTPPAWVRQFGSGSSSGGTFAGAVASDNQSNVYMAGSTYGALPGQTSSGSLDGFIRKYDSSGNELWTRQFGSISGDEVNSMVVDGPNIYLVGYTDGALPGQPDLGDIDAFIRKYDTLGNEVWTRQFGTNSGDHAYGVAVDTAGNLYVSGDTWGAFPGYSSSGRYDGFVRKYDSAGVELWTRQFGTANSDMARAVAVDSLGITYVVGEIQGDSSIGYYDAFIRKFDASGTPVWMRRFDTGFADFPDSVTVDAVGGIYIAGYTNGALPGQSSAGDYDAFLCKYDGSGNALWSRQFGTASQDLAFGVAEGDSGNVFVFGMTEGALPGQTSSGPGDAFIRTYDSSGNVTWTHQFGTGAATSASDAAMGTASDFYVVGGTYGTLPGQTSTGQRDVFIAKFTSPSVPTNNATDITINSARLNGTLNSLGSASSAKVSFLWGTVAGDLTSETGSQAMDASGAFNANLPGLSANTTYYFRAKATGDSTSYGTEKDFTTKLATVDLSGDANGDGVVNALDITKLERIIAHLDSPTPGANANQDGNINALDITTLERLIVGLN